MDQYFEIHSEQHFHFVRENVLLNDSLAEGGMRNPITDQKVLVSGVLADGLGICIELFHPLKLHRHGLFGLGLARCPGRGSRGTARCSNRSWFFYAFFGFVVVFALASPADHASRHAPHHGHDGVAEIHFAAGAETDEFFSNGESSAGGVHTLSDKIA